MKKRAKTCVKVVYKVFPKPRNPSEIKGSERTHAKTFDFDGARLQAAIFETLQRRGTPYDRNSFKRVVSLAEDVDMQKRWKYFLKTIKDDTLEFSAVIEEIQTFLEPVFEAIVNEDEWQGEWESNISRWSHLGGGIDHDKSN